MPSAWRRSFIDRLPAQTMSPETTSGYEGFVHPYQLDASVDRTRVKVLIRDFVTAALAGKEALVERLAREVVGSVPGAAVEIKVEESYRNMREVLDRHPDVVERARDAIRRAGLEPIERPIRGGTDGSRLSFMGLPTPNLFAGEHNFHSRLEWVSVQDMEKAMEVIVELARVWCERAGELHAKSQVPSSKSQRTPNSKPQTNFQDDNSQAQLPVGSWLGSWWLGVRWTWDLGLGISVNFTAT